MIYHKNSSKESIHFSVLFLGLYFLLLPFDFIDIGNETSLLKFLSLLPVCMIFLNFKNIKVDIAGSFLLLLYIFLNVISIFHSADADLSTQRTKSVILNYVMIVFCSTLSPTLKEKNFLLKAVVVSGFVALCLILFMNDFYEGRIIMKIGESKQDPNYYCGYLMFTTVYMLSLVLSKTRKALSITLFIVLYLTVFLTGSRGGLIAIAISCLVLFYFESKSKNFFLKVLIFAILIFILYSVLINLVPPEVRMRFDPSFTKNDGGAGRFKIWEALWKEFEEFSLPKKILGTGAATIKEFGLKNVVAHNLWLETLIELGYIGLFVQIAIYVYFLLKALKLKNKIYFATLIGFLVMTLSMSLSVYKPIFALFIMINIMSHKEREEIPQQIL